MSDYIKEKVQEIEVLRDIFNQRVSSWGRGDAEKWFNTQVRDALQEMEERTAEDICVLIYNIELNRQDEDGSSMEEWRLFKRIRNAIRDKYALSHPKKDTK